jgi:hypothetical protein
VSEEAGAREDTLESKDEIGRQKQLIAALQDNLAYDVSKFQESRFERSPTWSRMQTTASAIRTNIGSLRTGITRMQLKIKTNSAGASVECGAHSDDLYSESMSRGYEIPGSKDIEKRKKISPDSLFAIPAPDIIWQQETRLSCPGICSRQLHRLVSRLRGQRRSTAQGA